MNYTIFEIIISYGVLLIGFGIMKFSDVLVIKWKRNILTICVAVLGMMVVGYSFLKIGRESSMYIHNYLSNPYFEEGLAGALIKMCIPMIILIIIGAVSLKLSDLYKKKSKKNMYEVTILSSTLSVFGSFIMFLTIFFTSLNDVLHLM